MIEYDHDHNWKRNPHSVPSKVGEKVRDVLDVGAGIAGYGIDALGFAFGTVKEKIDDYGYGGHVDYLTD